MMRKKAISPRSSKRGAFQTKISDRVALVAQNQTMERLASEGVKLFRI